MTKLERAVIVLHSMANSYNVSCTIAEGEGRKKLANSHGYRAAAYRDAATIVESLGSDGILSFDAEEPTE